MTVSKLAMLGAAIAGIAAGCSGTTDPPSSPQAIVPFTPLPLPPPEPEPAIVFEAMLHGAPWKAKAITVTKRENHTIEVTGSMADSDWTVTIRIAEAWQHGEYSLAADGNGSVLSIFQEPYYFWYTTILPGGGRVVLTHVSENRIAGTFEGYAGNTFGGEFLSIHQGRFNVRF